ncbi:MAG: hypothetical protein Q9162_005823 [Coniocarpon cinnabarinum]
MRVVTYLGRLAAAALALAPTTFAAQNASTNEKQSTSILPSTFKPPQVFKNTNLVRNTNIDKGYVRDTINVVIENVDNSPQSQYFVPFQAEIIPFVGGFEAKDRNNADAAPFKTAHVEFDEYSPTQYYRIDLPKPLAPKEQLTMSITYHLLAQLTPVPPAITQAEKQYLSFTFNAYANSAYPTSKQRTKLKLNNQDTPDYDIVPPSSIKSDNSEDPTKSGNSLTYGPFNEVPAGAYQPVSARFDFTKPINRVETLERDFEISHWGGNLATEERYLLSNAGAGLKENFNRVQWTATKYYNPPTSALKELKIPLSPGARDPYFVDDVGNVSTSRFRRGDIDKGKKAMLELHPRYPVFGGWQYKFKIGWDRDARDHLRKTAEGEHVLRVPFLEGPRQNEGIYYERVKVRVILPEGAENVRWETGVPVEEVRESRYKTFMDTLGRTSLELTARNLCDDWTERDLVVMYEYPAMAAWRKPLTIVGSMLGVFGLVFALSRVDVSISGGK